MIEGRRQVDSDLKFNYAQNKAVFTGEKPGLRNPQASGRSQFPPCVTDSLSAIFYAASQPVLTMGQSFQFPLADAMRTVPVTMKVEGREEVNTVQAHFRTLRV